MGIRLEIVLGLVLLLAVLVLGSQGVLGLVIGLPPLVECLLNRQAVVGELLAQLLQLGLQLRVALQEGVDLPTALLVSTGSGSSRGWEVIQANDQGIVLQYGLQQALILEVVGRDLRRDGLASVDSLANLVKSIYIS